VSWLPENCTTTNMTNGGESSQIKLLHAVMHLRQLNHKLTSANPLVGRLMVEFVSKKLAGAPGLNRARRRSNKNSKNPSAIQATF
jgi:hypothetical protein